MCVPLRYSFQLRQDGVVWHYWFSFTENGGFLDQKVPEVVGVFVRLGWLVVAN